jgi:hypothetical protein
VAVSDNLDQTWNHVKSGSRRQYNYWEGTELLEGRASVYALLRKLDPGNIAEFEEERQNAWLILHLDGEKLAKENPEEFLKTCETAAVSCPGGLTPKIIKLWEETNPEHLKERIALLHPDTCLDILEKYVPTALLGMCENDPSHYMRTAFDHWNRLDPKEHQRALKEHGPEEMPRAGLDVKWAKTYPQSFKDYQLSHLPTLKNRIRGAGKEKGRDWKGFLPSKEAYQAWSEVDTEGYLELTRKCPERALYQTSELFCQVDLEGYLKAAREHPQEALVNPDLLFEHDPKLLQEAVDTEIFNILGSGLVEASDLSTLRGPALRALLLLDWDKNSKLIDTHALFDVGVDLWCKHDRESLKSFLDWSITLAGEPPYEEYLEYRIENHMIGRDGYLDWFMNNDPELLSLTLERWTGYHEPNGWPEKRHLETWLATNPDMWATKGGDLARYCLVGNERFGYPEMIKHYTDHKQQLLEELTKPEVHNSYLMELTEGLYDDTELNTLTTAIITQPGQNLDKVTWATKRAGNLTQETRVKARPPKRVKTHDQHLER